MEFVFGSNERGVHGAGAAAFAVKHKGAIMGNPVGLQGRSYAIPTKDKTIKNTLPLEEINKYVKDFLKFAEENPHMNFQITRIGCGLAGLRDKDIAPMFKDAPFNCYFDEYWYNIIDIPFERIWGSF